MTAACEDATLASQCLDFCQMLAGKSLSFSFSLKVGNNFSFSVETKCKKERRVFEEKTCSYCWEVWTRSFWGRDWFSWKSSDCATSPPVATSIFGEAEGDHCREGEGSAHIQPAGWCSSSCPTCCQEGDDIKVRVLLLTGVGNRPACVPWDESRLQGHLSCLPCEGDWDWWLWGVQPWARLHHRQEIWRPPKPEVQVLPMNAKPLNVLILIASCEYYSMLDVLILCNESRPS